MWNQEAEKEENVLSSFGDMYYDDCGVVGECLCFDKEIGFDL